jgi:hypothetical protein
LRSPEIETEVPRLAGEWLDLHGKKHHVKDLNLLC